jgi:hypothetical protein
MRVSVGGEKCQAMAEALFHFYLQRVIAGRGIVKAAQQAGENVTFVKNIFGGS